MSNTKKVKCPHCRGVDEVDVKEELEKNKETTVRGYSNKPGPGIPKHVAVKCSHCGESFRISIG